MLRSIPALSLVLMLTGCAATSTVTGHFGQPPHLAPGTSLLLASRHPDLTWREQWEQGCAPVLEAVGMKVERSSALLPEWFEGGHDTLVRTLQAAGRNDPILLADLTTLPLPRPPAAAPPTSMLDANAHLDPQATAPDWRQYRQERDRPTLTQRIELQWIEQGQVRWRAEADSHEAQSLRRLGRSQCQALLDGSTGPRDR